MLPRPPSRRASAAALLALLIAGCSVPRVAPPTQPTVTSTPAQMVEPADAPPKATRGYVWTPQLDDTARRLRSALGGGTTVAVTTDQRLWISLPTDETFAAGRSAVRPVAAAWLDQIALALRGLRRAEVQIVASADPSSRGAVAEALALDRAASTRDWLVGRGIPAPRTSVAAVAARAASAQAERRIDIFVGERADGSAR